MFCRECGKEVQNQWANCPFCTAVIYRTDNLQPSPEPAAPVIQNMPQYSPPIEQNYQNPFVEHPIIDDGKPTGGFPWGRLLGILGILLFVIVKIGAKAAVHNNY
ncbi:MAG: hypothetical protein QGG96_00735 [Candidatus Poseidoniaceae archaeon]|jgi:hypothetical protein|nr:hypothetical protein [Candidatus Poseidoniaceae archaeon]